MKSENKDDKIVKLCLRTILKGLKMVKKSEIIAAVLKKHNLSENILEKDLPLLAAEEIYEEYTIALQKENRVCLGDTGGA